MIGTWNKLEHEPDGYYCLETNILPFYHIVYEVEKANTAIHLLFNWR